MTQEARVLKKVEPMILLEEFVQDCKDRHLSEGTIISYTPIVKNFLRFLQGQGVHPFDVDRFVLKEYLRYRRGQGLDQKTLDNNFVALSTFYGFLAFEGYVNGNPVLVVRKRFLSEYKGDEDDDPPRKLISVEEMSMLVNSILNPRDRAVAVLLAKTGLRRSELVSLDVEDIDWAEQSITLKRKSSRRGAVELCSSMMSVGGF